MIRAISMLAGLILVTMLNACSSQWVRLDGSQIEDTDLRQARAACQIDEKNALLEQAEVARSARFAQAKSNADKMLARENFDIEKQRINAEIEACMRDQGLKRKT